LGSLWFADREGYRPVTHSTMTSDYVLLIRNTAWQKDFSAEDIEKVLNEFSAWVESHKKKGKIKVAVPLAHTGKLFEGQNTIVDGPFIEAKEAIAGLIIFQSDSLEEAIEFANSATCLKFGQTLELRPIATEEPERSASRIGNRQ
jgi:hypothetical protein